MSVIVENITKYYGSQTAVNDISFSVNKGEILGFLGPNGAGKSTTMKMITGFVNMDQGNISVCGMDVAQAPLSVQKKIGYLPESNPLYGDMYIKEYLDFVANIYKLKAKKERIQEVIELTGLELEEGKKIHQLSKGYKQRVGLAQAILHDPEVLILDEPTSGLDPNQLIEIRNLITSLGKEKTVIFSSHIMQEVQAICDRVIIIDRGNLVLDDSISMLQSANRQERSITIEFENSLPADGLKSLQEIIRIEQEGNRYQIWTSKENDIRAKLFDTAVAHNTRILAMTQNVISIEDVFKEITT